ncbi:MAG: polyketide synthase, partial [Candidatus Electrothrix sp. AR3]|nr:polyketide synthase [Candidatus Electrothrix sp. AR3]
VWRIDPSKIIKGRPGKILKDTAWTGVGGYLKNIEPFSQASFGTLDPSLDTIFHLLAHTVQQALKEGGWIAAVDTLRTGLIMGNLGYPVNGFTDFAVATLLDTDWFQAEKAALKLHPANRFSSALPLHYTAELFGLNGPCFALDAACASALYAIKLACDQLHSQQADMMLAGGINASDFLCLQTGFAALGALSRTGRSQPFSQTADGLIPAQGAALVLLKRFDDALRDNDRIIGIIRSVGLSNDGRAGSFLTPSSAGQLRALRQAYVQAEVSPDEVSYIECHATGTPLGDPVEIRALDTLYHNLQRPQLGSLKANIGHSITASGAAGLLKVLAMMEHGCLAGTPNVQPLHQVFQEAPFEVPEGNRQWSGRKLAGISSFGFGGNNAHLLVDAWEPTTAAHSFPVAEFVPQREQVFALVGIEVKTHCSENYAAFQQQLGQKADRVRQEPIIEQISLGKKELIFPPADLQGALGQQLLSTAAAAQAMQGLSFDPEQTGIFIGMQPDGLAARYSMRARLPALFAAVGVKLKEVELEQARKAVSPPCMAAEVIGAMTNITANRLNHIFSALGTGYAIFAEELSGD